MGVSMGCWWEGWLSRTHEHLELIATERRLQYRRVRRGLFPRRAKPDGERV